MSAAACAKVRIDSGRAAGAAQSFATLVSESASAMEMLYGLKDLKDAEKDLMLDLSAKHCKWADVLDKWTKETLVTVTTIAAGHGVPVEGYDDADTDTHHGEGG